MGTVSERYIEMEVRKDKWNPLRITTYALLLLGSAVTIIPLIWLICAAFKKPEDLYTYTFLSPDPTLQNFKDLFTQQQFGRYLLNSFFLSSVNTSVSLILASMGGFALAKYDFKGKQFLTSIMLATMMLPYSVLLAPSYELICKMGLMDNFLGLLLPGAVGAFGMLLFRQAMFAIPDDLIEAARIDGCSEMRIYWNVVMPVVRPMSGAYCLMAFMGTWNSFLWPMIVLNSKHLFTIPIFIQQTVGSTGDSLRNLMMAATLLGVIPPAILFFILQKEFIAGLTAGAVKG